MRISMVHVFVTKRRISVVREPVAKILTKTHGTEECSAQARPCTSSQTDDAPSREGTHTSIRFPGIRQQGRLPGAPCICNWSGKRRQTHLPRQHTTSIKRPSVTLAESHRCSFSQRFEHTRVLTPQLHPIVCTEYWLSHVAQANRETPSAQLRNMKLQPSIHDVSKRG